MYASTVWACFIEIADPELTASSLSNMGKLYELTVAAPADWPSFTIMHIYRRDAAEREAQEEAAAERERLRNMTEEERLAWLKANRPQVRGHRQG
jgi:hypothetical protein